MTTLTITRSGSARVHTIVVPSEHAVPIATEDSGTVDAVAAGANVVIRFGSPDADARGFVVIHDGDHRKVSIENPAYARAFTDRPLDDY
jgi:hypothetical protein